MTTAIPAFLLTKIIGKHLESLHIMGAALLIGGIVMWIVDAMNAPSEAAGPGAPPSRIHTWKMEAMSLGQAIWIGACQILSGGISRNVAIDVHDRGRTTGRDVAGVGAGVFFLPLDSDHGGGHRL